MPSYLINEISNVTELSYLELGIFTGDHLSSIVCKKKIGVDIDHAADFRMSTDEFFEQLDPEVKFDVVYIDADHDCRAIQRDFNNSLKHLRPTGSIFLHDLYPENQELTKPWYCNNGFIFLDALITQNYPGIYTLDGDYGVTLVHQPSSPIEKLDLNLSYKDFRQKHIAYPLQTIPSFIQIVKELSWE